MKPFVRTRLSTSKAEICLLLFVVNHPDSLDEVDPEKVMAEIHHPNGERVEWK